MMRIIQSLDEAPPFWPQNSSLAPPRIASAFLALLFGPASHQVIGGALLDTGEYSSATSIGYTLFRARMNALLTTHVWGEHTGATFPTRLLYPNISFPKCMLTVFLVTQSHRSKQLTRWILLSIRQNTTHRGLVQVYTRSTTGSLQLTTYSCRSNDLWSASTLVAVLSATVTSGTAYPSALTENNLPNTVMQLLVFRGGASIVASAARLITAEAVTSSANANSLHKMILVLESLSRHILGYNAVRACSMFKTEMYWHAPAVRPLLTYLTNAESADAQPAIMGCTCATVAVMTAAAATSITKKIWLPVDVWGVIAKALGGELIFV